MILSVKALKKSYNSVPAVDGISFDMNSGEILALLGPNGAGKTTTISILTGLITQDSGEIYYNGEKFHQESNAHKSFIGIVPQHNNVDRDLSVVKNLKIHGILFGIRGNRLSARIDEVLKLTELTQERDKKAGELSGGMKRRLIIARALLHEPKLLFLDEPSTGLDTEVRRQMYSLVKKLNSSGTSIVLTTHYMEEADVLADRVIFINKGKITGTGSPAELKAVVGKYALEYSDGDNIRYEYFTSRKDALTVMEKHSGDVRLREATLEDAYMHFSKI